MYNLWQVAGGKVENRESSLQAVLRETKEETALNIEKDECVFLFNDPAFNCDVYLTKVPDYQELQRTEPEKQGAWTITSFEQFQFMAKHNELTPILVNYYTDILNQLIREEPAYLNQKERAEEALYEEAIVYGQPVNVLIDSGAVGQKSLPLGMVQQVPVQMRDIKVYVNMIVTNSAEYNVLLGNEWLKKVNANIDYGQNTITIKYEGIQQKIPVTCSQKLDPTKYTVIDPVDELELEDELEDTIAVPFYKTEITKSTFQINDRKYHPGYLEYIKQQNHNSTGVINSKGPGKCLCKTLEDQEVCDDCQIVQEDWNIYHVKQESESLDVSNNIQLEPEKVVPIGELEESQYQLLHQLLDKNKDLFAKSLQETAPKENEFIESEINDMLEQRLIEPSTSPWSFPVMVVKKKNGKLKFCVNYKPLNNITKKDNYPLPRIDELLDSLQDAQWFTTLDLASGYWQIKVRAEDQEKTAFITKFGTYEFKVMPFGLCNAPATFQRTMDKVLHKIKEKFVLVYLDDVIIYSKTFKDHIQHLKEVLNRIRKANLRLKAEKCHFAAAEHQFLGHVVGKEGVKPDPEKVNKMVNYPEPQNIRELRKVLGLFSYYRRFIKDFAKVADPMYKLLKKDAPYEWTNLQQKAFENLRDKLTTAPIVQYPDFSKPFFLYTDASTIGLDAVLAQKIDDQEHVITYASRTLIPAEKNYAITELECLAIWLLNSTTENNNKRLERWKIALSEYKYDIVYQKGTKHANADAFSRLDSTSTHNHTNPSTSHNDHG
ncbi:gag-pol fusion protein [Rhizophagus irregularis DAOM 197198w]|uniref:Gag-pol fusion protein n=1 Tax=Rhizophagus irregularis (strain DAOM 197198w) TaxID=1432141 RepID=A0A015JCU6_RHIIW|nr:gag-pol fusion protein [Rhizophagus irregularis DAOM 197198w]